MKTMLCVAALVLSGCSFLKKGADEPIPYLHSPAGHRFLLYTDNGGVAKGLFSTDDLGRWVDARISAWVVQRAAAYGGEAKLRTMALSHSYYLVDQFEVSRNGQVIAGQYDEKRRLVTACVYGYVKVKAKPSGTFRFARPVGDGTQDWYHEVLVPGNEIPVVGHELDHGLGIGHKK